MEITISKQCLVTALGKTAAIADRKSSMQILSNVLLDADQPDGVRIASTDLHISASGYFPAKVVEPGAITIPAKTLHDVAKNLTDGMITLRTEEDNVVVTSGRANFKLLSLPAEDFPQLPDFADLEFFTMDSSLIARMIEKTFFSISHDETRPHINGALFQGEGKYLRMVTTDGHRLSKYETKVEESGFYNFSLVIPNKGIAEIKRLVEDKEGTVSIATRDGSVFFKRDIEVDKGTEGSAAPVAEFSFVSKLIEADFPPYDQVIPASHDRTVIASRPVFHEALRRVSVVSIERALGVKMVLNEGSTDIMSDNPSVGQGTEQVDVDYSGESLEIGFNARYFLDVLGVLDTEEIKIELSGALDPVVVKDMDENFIGVIMPMRI